MSENFRKPGAFAPVQRAVVITRLIMIWERLVPVVTPYVILAALIAVAGQWGLFQHVTRLWHIGLLVAGAIIATMAAITHLLRFRLPGFIELYQRIAVDNDMPYERILNLRHQHAQPRLRIGQPKAGMAEADPLALRFVAVLMAVLGYLIFGPVPTTQIHQAFTPLSHQYAGTMGPEGSLPFIQRQNVRQAAVKPGAIQPIAH